jgi:hypothetical protein
MSELGDEEGAEKRVMIKTATKKTSPIAKARANVIKFCEILDDLPINFSFKLNNVSKDFKGSWKKTVLNGATAWQNGPRILFNSSFYLKRKQVFEAIERGGWPIKQLYFPDTKPKITPLLTKEKVKELYYKQKKSLQDIAKEYGYTRQWVFLLMEKYGLKRRTGSEALREAVRQNKIALIRLKR